MKILFCCSGGITSSIISGKIKKIIADTDKEYSIETIAATYISNHLEGIDLIILAPHVLLSQNKIEEYQIPVIQIPQDLYGSMDGELILNYIEKNMTVGEEKVISHIDNWFIRIVKEFTNMRVINVIMNAFMNISALSFAGSLFTLLISLPLGNWYLKFLNDTGLYSILKIPISITTNLLSVYLVISIGYQLAKTYNKDRFSAGVINLCAFLILIPMHSNDNLETYYSIKEFGYEGLFLAMITGLIATRIYVFCNDKIIKLKKSSIKLLPIERMLDDVLAGGIVFLVFLCIRQFFLNTNYETAQQFIYSVVQAPLQNVGGGLPAIFAFTFFSNFSWLFGVHGSMVAYVAMMPIMTPIGLENTAAFVAGEPVPHPEWLLTPWTTMGGGGSTLALCILMVVLAKSSHLKSLGRMAFVTSVFQINEPLIFGIPIVLNPIMAIPFLVVPLVNLTLSLLVINLKIIAAPTGAGINSFMPFGVYGALTSAHWSGLVWSVILLGIDIVVYYPFFKMLDYRCISEELEYEKRLNKK